MGKCWPKLLSGSPGKDLQPLAWTCWGHLCNKERGFVLTNERCSWRGCINVTPSPTVVHVHSNEQVLSGLLLALPCCVQAGRGRVLRAEALASCSWWHPSPRLSMTLEPQGVVSRRGDAPTFRNSQTKNSVERSIK